MMYLYLISQLILMNYQIPTAASTKYLDSKTIVIQIDPNLISKSINVGLNSSKITDALVFIPGLNSTINCPLWYFQQNVSLHQKWIVGDDKKKVPLTNIDKLDKVIITYKKNGNEILLKLPDIIEFNLLRYFKLEVCHNLNNYKEFECSSLICLLANVENNTVYPNFTFNNKNPKAGDFVVLSENTLLPVTQQSLIHIKHWALYLGNNQYLSKFGKSTKSLDGLVSIMTLKRMMHLYKCKFSYVAIQKVK